MKNIVILLSCILIGACNPPADKTEGIEQDSSLSIEELLKNSKIEKGKAQIKELNAALICNGRIEIPPSDNISIHSKSDGYITKINYLPGEYVKKGSLLLSIENPSIIEKQRLFLETKADFQLAEKELARKTELKEKEATSSREYDAVLSKYNRLMATYNGLKSELQNIGINVSRLSSTSYQNSIGIFAKTSSYVSSVDVNKGQYITAETLLMQLASNSHLHLELKIFDSDAARVQIGQKVTFNINSSSTEFNAEIVHINPVLDAKDGSLKIHCHFEDNEELKAGMFVQAVILTETEHVLALPKAAVLKEGNEFYGFKVQENEVEKIALHNVKSNDQWITSVEIQDSLNQWITKGSYYIGEVESTHSH
ncbi:MAG: efflux RND transporter periplasmic adaptor subunit [Bacteroidia bacterium]|nr:efflux RND transporter periplasmic adaptor subunit [Bacteroidia bacterium]NNJ54971.1 efflux RND transporter periplasmic adaptor subunit [Bacteroidia bacterium]